MKRRDYPRYWSIVTRGMAVEPSFVIPGVLLGVVTFITDVYEELLASVKSINLKILLLIFQQSRFSGFLRAINGSFLLSILGNLNQHSFFYKFIPAAAMPVLPCCLRKWGSIIADIEMNAVQFSTTN